MLLRSSTMAHTIVDLDEEREERGGASKQEFQLAGVGHHPVTTGRSGDVARDAEGEGKRGAGREGEDDNEIADPTMNSRRPYRFPLLAHAAETNRTTLGPRSEECFHSGAPRVNGFGICMPIIVDTRSRRERGYGECIRVFAFSIPGTSANEILVLDDFWPLSLSPSPFLFWPLLSCFALRGQEIN